MTGSVGDWSNAHSRNGPRDSSRGLGNYMRLMPISLSCHHARKTAGHEHTRDKRDGAPAYAHSSLGGTFHGNPSSSQKVWKWSDFTRPCWLNSMPMGMITRDSLPYILDTLPVATNFGPSAVNSSHDLWKCPHTRAMASPCWHPLISQPVLHVACEQRCLGRTLCWQQVEDAHDRHNAPFIGVLPYRVLITGPNVPLLDAERFAILRHSMEPWEHSQTMGFALVFLEWPPG